MFSSQILLLLHYYRLGSFLLCMLRGRAEGWASSQTPSQRTLLLKDVPLTFLLLLSLLDCKLYVGPGNVVLVCPTLRAEKELSTQHTCNKYLLKEYLSEYTSQQVY